MEAPRYAATRRFAPLLEGAIARFPFLEESGVIRLLCHPDAMTPDGNPLLGPDGCTPIPAPAPVVVTVNPGAPAAEVFTVPGD